jgi:hypothetical protein
MSSGVVADANHNAISQHRIAHIAKIVILGQPSQVSKKVVEAFIALLLPLVKQITLICLIDASNTILLESRNNWVDLLSINIKNCKALLKKVVIGRAVTALKQQKSKGKGKGGEKGIAEIVHFMKPITRSPDTTTSSSSSSNK